MKKITLSELSQEIKEKIECSIFYNSEIELYSQEINISKSGLATAWESGGAYTNTGFATIVAGKDGEKITPIYVCRNGHLSCAEHALFHVKCGYFLIEADRQIQRLK